MIKAYRHLYQKVEVFTMDGESDRHLHIWALHPNARGYWLRHLLPKHKAFFDSLDDWERFCVTISSDPFEALKNFHLEKLKEKP